MSDLTHHSWYSGGLTACTMSSCYCYTLPVIPACSVQLHGAAKLELPCFTHMTAISQQLPVLNSLMLNLHSQSAHAFSWTSPTVWIQTPPSPPSSFYLYSDSSDDEPTAYIHNIITHNMSTPAATIDPTSVKAPVLTAGDISLVVMMDFKNAAQDFFVAKSMPADRQVANVIPGLKDIRIHDWITADCEHIVALPFVDFMKELHANYLQQWYPDFNPCQFQYDIWNWAQHPLKWGTSSIFDDAALHNHLEAHLNNDLKACVRHSDACKDKAFQMWVSTVHLINKAHSVETKHQQYLNEETLQHQPKYQNADSLQGPSHCANTSQSNASSSSSTSIIHLPALTDAKHILLNGHEGCTKFWCFYVGHCSQSCLNGFPVGKGYKTLTLTDVLAAKKAKAIAKTSTKAVMVTIEAINSNKELTTAIAVLPKPPRQLWVWFRGLWWSLRPWCKFFIMH